MANNGKTIFKIVSMPLYLRMLVVFILLLIPFGSTAQSRFSPDTLTEVANVKDTLLKSDSSIALNDTDTAGKPGGSLEDRLGIRISSDALEEKVVASASDSAIMDVRKNYFSLFGDATVDYDGRKLSADRIDFDQNNNIATATKILDTNRKDPKPPTFVQGEEKFTYDSLKYNFKSERAIVSNARTQYGEGFVHSEQIKRNADKSLYGYKNVYTTCNLDHPHFGIRTNRIKIIPEQAIAMGSANIEIEGVPTPAFLPFGYFPVNNDKHRSGFILPDYTVEAERGLGFRNAGYYFYINDYVDLILNANIYTKGSFLSSITSNYVTRYRYNGNVFLSYSLNKTGEEFDPSATIQKSFAIRWQHYQDQKARPGVTFNASIDVQTGNYNSLNTFSASQITQNQFLSNISFAKNWIGKPYSLTLSATHNQNNISKLVTVTLPNLNFNVVPQNVFQRKNPVGSPRWYENITVGYNLVSLNEIRFYDTAFQVNQLRFRDFNNGIRHNVPVAANYSVLRFFTISFNANYNEYWNPLTSYVGYNDSAGKLDTTTNYKFAASRDFNSSLTVNTKIYGMKMFKKGAIRGIRHEIRPSVGIGYRPDFAKKPFNYYYQTRTDSTDRLTWLSPYSRSVVGLPPQGRSGTLNFTLNNNLQMKVRSAKDTATGFKNIALLDALDFSTTYNMAADSFQWSDYVISARTNILNKVNFSAQANFDPYAFNYDSMRRSKQLTYNAGQGWARLSNVVVSMGAGFRSKQTTNANKSAQEAENSDEYRRLMRNDAYSHYVDFRVPWSLNLTYSLNLNRQVSVFSKSDTSVINQYVTFNGDLNLTPRWKLAFNSGYDFVLKKLTLTEINIYRDLHCWEMRLGFFPFGPRKSFTFTLNVKAQVLQDLRIQRRRSFFDAVR